MTIRTPDIQNREQVLKLTRQAHQLLLQLGQIISVAPAVTSNLQNIVETEHTSPSVVSINWLYENEKFFDELEL